MSLIVTTDRLFSACKPSTMPQTERERKTSSQGGQLISNMDQIQSCISNAKGLINIQMELHIHVSQKL
jgi:hypothetical protein